MMKNVIERLSDVVKKHPHKKAVELDDSYLSYKDLYDRASQYRHGINLSNKNIIGLWCPKTLDTYAALVGILLEEKAYLPLNPEFPTERLIHSLSESEADMLIYQGGHDDEFTNFLESSSNLKIILKKEDFRNFTEFNNHEFFFFEDFEPVYNKTCLDSNSNAYLLFTSGTTGRAKGVPISHLNLTTYVNNIINVFDFNEDDRFSHTFDLTFDLSIHDIFICFSVGGTLVIPSTEDIYFPHLYIENKKISVWFSVPSLAMNMDKLGLLDNHSYPGVRYSFFCGEGLPLNAARKWLGCMKNSKAFNLYGPTEATIAFSYYELGNKSKNGIVSIGQAFTDLKMKIKGNLSKGELLLGGEQLTSGYWNDLEKTKMTFINEENLRWYCTGDLAEKDSDGDYYFLGRVDQQIKYNGYRIEILEIEVVLREIIGHELCFCVPYPIVESKIEGIVAVVEGLNNSSEELIKKLSKILPEYMIPNKFVDIKKTPLNSNGKVDRNKLLEILTSIDGL